MSESSQGERWYHKGIGADDATFERSFVAADTRAQCRSMHGRSSRGVLGCPTSDPTDEGTTAVERIARRGNIEALGDLTKLDLLQFCRGSNPWEGQPNVKVRYEPGDNVRLRDLIERIGFVGIGRVIDIGCGYGRITPFLAEVNDSVDGLDHNEGALEIARAIATLMGLDNCAFHHGSATALSFDDGVFDGFFCHAMLNYAHRGQVLSEARRVLKPGGRLFIGKYNSYGIMLVKYLKDFREKGREAPLAKWVRNVLSQGPLFDGRPNLGSADTIGQVLEDHGFAVTADFGCHAYPSTWSERSTPLLPVDLSDEERQLFHDHERLLQRLETDDDFVEECLERGDELLAGIEGDIDVVAVKS